jgi:anti-sigma factor RsiW
MNERYLSSEDQRLLDRLVDGELNDAERRELLLRLERTPDGWRWCAAAFLEAQAWRGEARDMISPQPAHSQTAGLSAKLQPASLAAARPSVQIWMPLALAAGLLVATTWVFLNRNPDATAPNGQPVAGNPPTGSPIQVAGDPSIAPSQRVAPQAQNLQLVVNGGPDGRRNVEVPLVDAAGMDEALFGQWSQSLPPEVIRMLEQNGHQVVRERRLVPFNLNDGRRVVVPMDQVEIRPVNMQTFQ